MEERRFYQQMLRCLSPDAYKSFVIEDSSSSSIFTTPIASQKISKLKSGSSLTSVGKDATQPRGKTTSTGNRLQKASLYRKYKAAYTPPPIINTRCRLRKTKLLNRPSKLSEGSPIGEGGASISKFRCKGLYFNTEQYPDNSFAKFDRRTIPACKQLSVSRTKKKLELRLPELPFNSSLALE